MVKKNSNGSKKKKLAVAASNSSSSSLTPDTSILLRKLQEELKEHEKVHKIDENDLQMSQANIRNNNESCKALLRRMKTTLLTLVEQLLNPTITTEKNIMRVEKFLEVFLKERLNLQMLKF